jgi:signal transduction histidine kinase
VHEPTPEQYNPPLTWRAHAWRTATVLLISAVLWVETAILQWQQARVLFWLDIAVGLATLVLSFYRRRWPLTVALLTNAASVVSLTAAGPSTLTAVSLATRRVVWQVVLVGVVSLVAAMVFPMFEPSRTNDPWWITFAVGFAFTVALLVWGMYLGSRRELLWTLRDRAERAEAEQELRVEQGRSNERARIAREMHDVLAHRISLVSMHAGALAYRTDLTSDQVRETAGLIEAKAHEALNDLRQVLGVLRDQEDVTGVQERPQPTFQDLAALVLEAQTSGMRVQYDAQVLDAETMPEQVGRTTYRIVQEGLTNARKHAPSVTVIVTVAGSRATGVDITIRNPARSAYSPVNGASTPGAGLGLVGLVERAKLAGGHLDTRRERGSFELHGWLPWTP